MFKRFDTEYFIDTVLLSYCADSSLYSFIGRLRGRPILAEEDYDFAYALIMHSVRIGFLVILGVMEICGCSLIGPFDVVVVWVFVCVCIVMDCGS